MPSPGREGISRAPIRNRAVDLLLTMETLCRLSYWGTRGTRIHGRGAAGEPVPGSRSPHRSGGQRLVPASRDCDGDGEADGVSVGSGVGVALLVGVGVAVGVGPSMRTCPESLAVAR